MKRLSMRGKHVAECRKEARAMIKKRHGYAGAFRVLFKLIGI